MNSTAPRFPRQFRTFRATHALLLTGALLLLQIASESAFGQTLNPDSDAYTILNGDIDNASDPSLANIFGDHVASAGDFNGDGLDDVIIADSADSHGTRHGGSVYLFFGGISGTLNDPENSADLIVRGHGQFGSSIASASDFNGDGLDDIIIGWRADPTNGLGAGSAFVFFGRSTITQRVLDAHADADIVISGRANSGLGVSVASAGDFNGDGRADIAVGGLAHQYNGACVHNAYLFFGRSAPPRVLDAASEADVTLAAQTCSTGFGRSLSSAGDFNGDGFDDVIVGTFAANDLGGAYIYFGGQTGLIDQPESNADVILRGTGGLLGYGQFGLSVATAGDYNGDGLGDVVLGDRFYYLGDGLGGAFLFFGGRTGENLQFDADLIVSMGGDALGGDVDWLGWAVAGAGDFNTDGFDDVILGAPGTTCEDCNPLNGNAYIYFGPRTGTFSDADISADVVIRGEDSEDQLGWSVGAAGDFDGDGISDVVVGAPGDNNGPAAISGATFIFRGSRSTLDTEPPLVSDVIATPYPIAVGEVALLSATVSDELSGGSDISSASYVVGEGFARPLAAQDGSFDGPEEAVSAVVDFSAPGVYELCVRGTDAAGNTSAPVCLLVPVFDPVAGFVTGGGYIQSPVGACSLHSECAAASGKANFGFVAKYHKGQEVPEGSVEFNFPSGRLNFHSSSLDWLVIEGARAELQGAGTVNGAGDYGFLLTVIDGKKIGQKDDRFRVQIWDMAAGDTTVYDSEPGAPDHGDPATVTAGGQIVIH